MDYLRRALRVRLALRLRRASTPRSRTAWPASSWTARRACSRCSRWPIPRRPRTTTTPCASWRSPSSPWPRSRATRRSRRARRRCARRPARALDNILETTELVNPEGGYHESMDYMRITFAPLALMAELRRTTTGDDPARRFGVFRNMGPTYLYKVLPDGSTARDDDNEFPHLDDARQRGARLRRPSLQGPVRGLAPAAERLAAREVADPGARVPVERRHASSRATPRPPRAAELPRERLFPGIGHLVLRDGWGPDSTWIAVLLRALLREARPPRHQPLRHLPPGPARARQRRRLHRHREPALPELLPPHRRAQHAARVPAGRDASSGARTCWPAANDGGQRMDSSRFWNSVRSLEDWRRTRDLWDRGRIEAFDRAARRLHLRARRRHARLPPEQGRALRARAGLAAAARACCSCSTACAARTPSYRKAWLLHGVSRAAGRGARRAPAERRATAARSHARRVASSRSRTAQGRLRVHARAARRSARSSCAADPASSSGRRATSAAAPGARAELAARSRRRAGRCPPIPISTKMWRTFWGEDFAQLSPSNRRAVVPGGWRHGGLAGGAPRATTSS